MSPTAISPHIAGLRPRHPWHSQSIGGRDVEIQSETPDVDIALSLRQPLSKICAPECGRTKIDAMRFAGHFAASFDSLDIMERAMRHFYLRARIEERMGAQADWNAVDSLMQKALAAAEKVARYKHAQLSSVRLAGDISGKMDDVTLDELLVTIKQEWAKLSPLIDLDAVEEPEPQGVKNRLTPPKGH